MTKITDVCLVVSKLYKELGSHGRPLILVHLPFLASQCLLSYTSRHPLAERAILAECLAGHICIIVLKVIGVSELI
jgi:hypothetical protein